MKRFLLSLTAMLVVMGLNLVNASTCADLNAVTSSSGVSFTLDQVTVVYVKAPYIYVQDATGTSLIYSNWNAFKRLQPGDVVSSVTGTAKLYSKLPELQPTDSMITVVSGPAPAIPDATAAPTTADINKVWWFRDVNMGAQSFPSNKAQNLTGTFLGGSALFRNAWKEAYQFDSTKTYDILGCVAIYNTTIQVYAAQILQHTEDLHSSITVGVQKPSEWNGLYLHYWNTSLGSTNWPGEAVAVDSLGWAYFTFPNDTAINYIWNSGDGTQTVNLTTNRSVCQRLLPPQPHISNSQYTALEVECGALDQPTDTVTPQPVDTVTPLPISSFNVGFQANNWESLYLYAWTDTGEPLGGWPGIEVQRDSLGWAYYTFNLESVNYIWNDYNNHKQTKNLATTESKCERVGSLLDDTQYNAVYDVEAVACGSAWPSDTVTPTPIDTITPTPVDTTGHDTIPQPVEGFTIKLLGMSVPSSWNEVRLFSWTAGVDPALSTDYGLALTLDSLGWYSYTFENLPVVDFLFNNGAWGAGNQTVDVKAAVDLCFALGDPNTTGNNHYPVIDVDCIHPDSITPTPVDTTSSHTVYLTDNITHAIFGMIQVPYGGTAVLPMDSLPYYEGYHFVFWEGLYDGSNVIENVTSDLWMQAKYYITLPEQPVISAIPVRLKASSVPQSWEHVYVYSWTQGAMNEPWPGAEMRLDSTGWYTYRFPAGVQNIDLLFNNGEGNVGNQTVDVDDINGEYCFRMGQPLDSITGYHIVYLADCEGVDTIAPQPQPEGITVRLTKEDTYGGWYGTYYVYAWQTIDSVDIPILGEWPGVEMNYDEQTNRYSYTFDEQYDNVNIVFSTENGVQTDDIRGITEDACFQVGPGMGWLNGMYVHNYVQVSCDQSIQYHLVYFYGINGDFLAVVRVADGEAAEAPVAPEVTGYTFMGWNQDFSHVTGQMNVYAVYQYNGASGDGITVRLLSTNGYGWENIYLYAWTNTGEPLGSWPGTLIPKDSTGWHAYTFTEDTLVNIIWNDGITGQGYTHQTQDIKNLGTSACYRLYGKDSIGFTTALTMDCDANPADYHTIAYMDVDFDNQLLLIGQVEHGATFEYSPTIPQHEGIVFQNWANAATGEPFDTNAPITEDLLIDEMYNHVYYWAYLVDWDGTIIASGQFAHGISITNINEFSGYCYREGYEFIGWSDSLQNITSARISVAQYKPLSAGNYTVTYSGKDGEFLDTQNIDLNLPAPATMDGYMFVGWQVVGGSLEQGIQVQATYEPIGGSGAPATEGEQAGPRKVIRDNNIYILTSDGKVYTSDGKLVERK